MPTKLNSIVTFIAIAIIANTAGLGQSDYNINDLNPTDVDLQRSDRSFSSHRPQQLPPIHSSEDAKELPPSSNSIFQNNLRGSTPGLPPQSKTAGDFASQPLPPTSKSGGNIGENQIQRNPMTRNQPGLHGVNKNTPADVPSQNPLHALNPSRLPDASSLPLAPANTGENQSNRYSASAIPSNSPSTRRSVMTPTTSGDTSEIIVAAGFENEDRTINTQTSGPASNKSVKTLISKYSIANSSETLPGVPTSLEDMLRTTDANARLRMVQQYWETYFDWATLQNRRNHENWLNSLSARAQTDQLLLQTAKSMAKNETLAAEIQLARSQSVLQEISRANPNEMLPLPLNEPVTSKYITHYQWYATRQLVPPKLKGINEMLPRTHTLLTQRAETVGQAERARNQTLATYTSGRIGIADLLESGRAWQASLQSMVATVVSYNKAISDYALTITPPQKPVSEIAAMLVSKPKAITAANLSSGTQRASAAGTKKFGQQRQISTSPQAVGPNAGVFRRSQNSSPVTAPMTNRSKANSSANPGASGTVPVGAAPDFRSAQNNVSGQLSPPPNQRFANPTSPSRTNRGNAASGGQFGGSSDGGRVQGNIQSKSGLQPNQQPDNNSSQLFGAGGGGSFGGG